MNLSQETFELYAAKYYDNPQCTSIEEFHDDLKRFQYLKRLFNRYKTSGILKEQLILNHIIILHNCFGAHTPHMLFMILDQYWSFLKPFVLLLNYMPDHITFDQKTVRSVDIAMDQNIVDRLRRI